MYMEQGLAKTGGAAEEARAKSDGALDFPSGSALGSLWKRQNPTNLVFDKFGSGKTEDAINTLTEYRDTLLNANARGNGVLDYQYCCLAL